MTGKRRKINKKGDSEETPEKGNDMPENHEIVTTSDIYLKDAQFFMSIPCSSLYKKPVPVLEYRNDYYIMRATSGVDNKGQSIGVASIYDNDVLLALAGIIAQRNVRRRKEREDLFGIDESSLDDNIDIDNINFSDDSEDARTIEIPVAILLKRMGRGVSGADYKRLFKSLDRLKKTTLSVEVTPKGRSKFGKYSGQSSFIDYFRFKDEGPKMVLLICISKYYWRFLIDHKELLSIDKRYLSISGGMERALYMLARKFTGGRSVYFMSVEDVKMRSGSQGNIREFRRSLKKIMDKNTLAEFGYEIQLEEGDRIKFRNLNKDKQEGVTDTDLRHGITPEVVKIWEGILIDLKNQFGDDIYNAWITPLQLESVSNPKIVSIAATSRFIRKTLQEKGIEQAIRNAWENFEYTVVFQNRMILQQGTLPLVG